jgi:hypothetical protein
MMDLSHAPAPTPAAAPAAAASMGNMFAGMSVGAPPAPAAPSSSAGFAPPAAPPLPPSPPPTPANTVSDVFADMDNMLLPNSSSASSSFGASPSSLKPLVIPTNEFGRHWGTAKAEVKQSVRCRSRDLVQLQQAMPQYLHHIESIGNTNEAIFAALVTNVGGVLLVHAKLFALKGQLDITVKSVSKEVCESELAAIASVLG